MNGDDLKDGRYSRFVVDFFGLNENQARDFPDLYQRLQNYVLSDRAGNRDQRIIKNWWLFRRSGEKLRVAIKPLKRFIGTTRTAKHRAFQFLPSALVAESKIVVIASEDAFDLGVLTSHIHVVFSLRIGGWLGVGNDPTYNHTDCFNKFPFPDCPEALKARIRELGEQLDAHRKRQQALHPKLTMTDMYNVLEKLRSGEELSAKEKKTHEEGLVSVLKQIHDDLDAAVFEAYGWPSTLSDEEILERLVTLNAERHAEEERGLIRWLRPEFQKQAGGTQQGLALEEVDAEEEEAAPQKKKGAKSAPKKAAPKKAAKRAKEAWPKTRALRTKGVQSLLAEGTPLSVAEIVKRFSRADEEQIEEILEALVLLGQAHYRRGKYSA